MSEEKYLHNFRRSLRYLWPYRKLLAISIACVLGITVLWGGGLGMALPVLKVLMDPEGLHGWAWNSMAGDRLDAKVAQQPVSGKVRIDEERLARVLHVVSVSDHAQPRKIRPNDWIVGLADGVSEHRVMDANAVSREIAKAEQGQTLRLRVYNPVTGEAPSNARIVSVELHDLDIKARMLGWVVSRIPEPETYPERYPLLVWLLLIIVGVTILRNFLRFVQEYLVEICVVRSIMDIRCDAYDATLRLPVTFFALHGTSDTTSRFVKDSNILAQGQVTLFGKTLAEPGKAIGSLAVAMFLSWKLTLIALIAGPPAVWLIRKFGKRMRKASKRALEGWSTILAVLEETLTGIRVVKAYTMENAERKRFFRGNRKLFSQQKKIARIAAATSPLIEAMGLMAGTVAAALAGYWVLQGHMDPYIFATWMGLMAAMFDPLRKLAKVITRFHQADAAGGRVFELLDREKERTAPGAPMLPRHSESIEFRNVIFRYPGAADDTLRGVDLAVHAGETIAIVGPNGSGKTTLLSLVPRLIDPTRGQVLIDGQDIADVSLRSLRRQIGLVTQETVLFHATIRENIAYGLRRPHPEDVDAAARRAFVDEFVDQLPDGYETMVGEHGATLSGGQRQRVAIARAILRDPAILIFDEAMSQVDAESERKIHRAMAEFVRDRTTLLIAHRFATVLSADRVVVLGDGAIIDVGTHDELLERCELYHHLYKTQLTDSGR